MNIQNQPIKYAETKRLLEHIIGAKEARLPLAIVEMPTPQPHLPILRDEQTYFHPSTLQRPEQELIQDQKSYIILSAVHGASLMLDSRGVIDGDQFPTQPRIHTLRMQKGQVEPYFHIGIRSFVDETAQGNRQYTTIHRFHGINSLDPIVHWLDKNKITANQLEQNFLNARETYLAHKEFYQKKTL